MKENEMHLYNPLELLDSRHIQERRIRRTICTGF